MNEIKEFWYESNACCGWVKTFDDLRRIIFLQLDSNSRIKNIDDFFDKSKHCSHGTYGTRLEHNQKATLRQYLENEGVYDSFIEYHINNL